MKKGIILLLLLATLAGCSKDDLLSPNGFAEYQNEAVIVGYYDVDDCIGGFALNIINDPAYTKMLNALEMPPGSDITKGSVFPIKVVFNWERDSTYCPGSEYIKIKKIMKID